jgi:carboxyl-terminal processing protease
MEVLTQQVTGKTGNNKAESKPNAAPPKPNTAQAKPSAAPSKSK